jgi:hypothetical protein
MLSGNTVKFHMPPKSPRGNREPQRTKRCCPMRCERRGGKVAPAFLIPISQGNMELWFSLDKCTWQTRFEHHKKCKRSSPFISMEQQSKPRHFTSSPTRNVIKFRRRTLKVTSIPFLLPTRFPELSCTWQHLPSAGHPSAEVSASGFTSWAPLQSPRYVSWRMCVICSLHGVSPQW